MKRVFSLLMCAFFLAGAAQAQVYKKELKAADKGLAKFSKASTSERNPADLEAVLSAVNDILKMEGADSDPAVYQLRADAHAARFQHDNEAMTLAAATGAQHQMISSAESGAVALASYKKAIEAAAKPKDQKTALKAADALAMNADGLARYLFDMQKYEQSKQYFLLALDIHGFLAEKGEASFYTTDENVNNTKYIAAVAAYYADDADAAKPLLEQLVGSGYDNVNNVAPILAKMLIDLYFKGGDEEKGLALLSSSRQKYPEDINLIYSEINYYIQKGKYEVLEGKLQEAIQREPDNKTLYFVLGNVYDNIYQKALKDQDMAKADSYMAKAQAQYENAIAKDPSYFDPTYQLGTLFYNRAAQENALMRDLESDYSSEGSKKYDAAKARMMEWFGKAQPYFEAAYKLNAKDQNTLLALREIAVRNNDMDKVNQYAKELEALGAGQ